MNFVFTAILVDWRGPAPFVFAPLPQDVADMIRQQASQLSYGWGCIAVTAQIGRTSFTTSLIPRHDTYFLPIKVAVQRTENIETGSTCECTLTVQLR